MSINRVILIGNLTRDPEHKFTPSGTAVAQMGIAVNRITKNDQGDYDVDFFNLVAFAQRADFAKNYLRRGNKVAIEGRLQSRSWVDQATSQKRTTYEIIVDNIQSLSGRSDGDNAPIDGGEYGSAPARPAAPASRPSGNYARPTPPAPSHDDLDDSDPFADE